MKKISFYLISLFAAVVFTACDEDFKDWAAPQTNEQESAKNLSFTVANAELAYDLAQITADSIGIAKQTALTNEADTKVTYEVLIDKTADFSGKLTYPLTISNGTLKIAKTDLQEAVDKCYGKRPLARELFLRVIAYVATPAEQVSRAQGEDLKVTVTPEAPIIESAYYVTGDLVGEDSWGPTTLVKFNHSGKDVYEDPTFTLIMECPKDKANFKIIPMSGTGEGADFWGAALGTAVNEDPALEGTIIGGPDAGAIQVAKQGWVKITLNMMAYTYTMEPLDVSPYLWAPGNHNGWADSFAKPAGLFSINMDMVYVGHMYLDGEFKFTPKANWDSEYASDGTADGLATSGANLKADAGFYYVKADIAQMKYELIQAAWGMIGNATVGGWDTSTAMAYDRASNCWSVTTDLVAGEFKFRANNEWVLDMGGSTEKLVLKGGNIAVTAPGNYTIKLYLTNDDTSYCTMTKN